VFVCKAVLTDTSSASSQRSAVAFCTHHTYYCFSMRPCSQTSVAALIIHLTQHLCCVVLHFDDCYNEQYMKLIQDPAALQAAMEQFATEGLESTLGGLGEGLEEYTVRKLVIQYMQTHQSSQCNT
jgi:hypothetical protein